MKIINIFGSVPFRVVIIVCMASILGSCTEEDLPTVQAVSLSESPLLGTWATSERTVTVYNGKEDPAITIGNNVSYEDSTYTELIEERFTFGIESQTDSVTVQRVRFQDDGSPRDTLVLGGRWTSGIIDDPDGPFSTTQYIIVFDPSIPILAVEDEYYRTYTIRDISDNSVTLSYTDTDRRDRNGRLYQATYQRQ